MTDEQMIEWLEHEGAVNSMAKARPIFKDIAARLRELGELLREATELIHDRNGACVDLQGENGKCDCCACEDAAAWLDRTKTET